MVKLWLASVEEKHIREWLCMTLARDDGKISTLSAAAPEIVFKVVSASLRITTIFNQLCSYGSEGNFDTSYIEILIE